MRDPGHGHLRRRRTILGIGTRQSARIGSLIERTTETKSGTGTGGAKKRKDKERKKDKSREERRSVLTGKKIKLKVHKDAGDHERDANRQDLLQFLNSTFE